MLPKKIELLAPARNLECGIAAINHGADAVYIGGPQFGAWAAAANSLTDIEQLVTHAHLFRARVYVALNTIFDDRELLLAVRLCQQLDKIIDGDSGLLRSSSGACNYGFIPDPTKSFNRGSTDYFLTNSRNTPGAIQSSKSTGQQLGQVVRADRRSFTLETGETVNNGDRLCFFDPQKGLVGIKANRVEDGIESETAISVEKTEARQVGTVAALAEKQLRKLGGTVFSLEDVRVELNPRLFYPAVVFQ